MSNPIINQAFTPRSTTREAYIDSNADLRNIQSIHDKLAAAGGGYLVFTPAAYEAVNTVGIDTSLVGIKFNGSSIDVAGIGGDNSWVTFYASLPGSSDLAKKNYTYEDGEIFASSGFSVNTGDTSGPGAIRLHSERASTGVRALFSRMYIHDCYKGISFKDRAYFVKFQRCDIKQNGVGLYQETSPTDFTERNVFRDCVFDQNDIHVDAAGGGYWNFSDGSFDYHYSKAFNIAASGKLILTNTHMEFRYGQGVSETTTPITITGAGSSLFWRGGTLAYAGSTQDFAWSSFISCDNTGNTVDITLDSIVKMGRAASNTTSYDALVLVSGSVLPLIRLRMPPSLADTTYIPAMSSYGATIGTGGSLRQGVEDTYTEIVHRTALTGTAAISKVTSNEGGVTMKNGANMLKIAGAGKVVVSFPVYETQRRHAWEFFIATSSTFAGSVTIKERQTGFAYKFDGTTITPAPDTRGAVYSGATVTVSAVNSNWVRVSWKNCQASTGVNPSPRQMIASVIMIEIDVTSMSAGNVYLADMAFDPL